MASTYTTLLRLIVGEWEREKGSKKLKFQFKIEILEICLNPQTDGREVFFLRQAFIKVASDQMK